MTTNPNEMTERVARIVHEAMSWAAQRPNDAPPPWYNGNSLAEDRAREAAREIAAMQSASPATSEDVVKLPQAALDAWVAYDPPALKHESARIRDAFMSGFLAASPTPRDMLVEAIRRAKEALDDTELNMANYDVDDVAALNTGATEAWLILDAALNQS